PPAAGALRIPAVKIDAAHDDRQLRRELRAFIKDKPVPDGMQDCRQRVVASLSVRSDLPADLLEPEIGGLNGFCKDFGLVIHQSLLFPLRRPCRWPSQRPGWFPAGCRSS